MISQSPSNLCISRIFFHKGDERSAKFCLLYAWIALVLRINTYKPVLLYTSSRKSRRRAKHLAVEHEIILFQVVWTIDQWSLEKLVLLCNILKACVPKAGVPGTLVHRNQDTHGRYGLIAVTTHRWKSQFVRPFSARWITHLQRNNSITSHPNDASIFAAWWGFDSIMAPPTESRLRPNSIKPTDTNIYVQSKQPRNLATWHLTPRQRWSRYVMPFSYADSRRQCSSNPSKLHSMKTPGIYGQNCHDRRADASTESSIVPPSLPMKVLQKWPPWNGISVAWAVVIIMSPCATTITLWIACR